MLFFLLFYITNYRTSNLQTIKELSEIVLVSINKILACLQIFCFNFNENFVYNHKYIFELLMKKYNKIIKIKLLKLKDPNRII